MGSYAVVDLEMCKVSNKLSKKQCHCSQETIQIGAVLLDENYEIVDRFCTYVHPEYGHISDFIAKMTGITSADVKDAPKMADAMKVFSAWLPEDVQLVSWSDSDRCQIVHELEGKQISQDRAPLFVNEWVDCQKLFGEKLKTSRPYNLTEALNLSDVFYEDGEHDGLVDAHNTALLFQKLQRTPDFPLNQYYMKLRNDTTEEIGTSLGSIFAGLNIQVVTA